MGALLSNLWKNWNKVQVRLGADEVTQTRIDKNSKNVCFDAFAQQKKGGILFIKRHYSLM